jgi:hypothetical protein
LPRDPVILYLSDDFKKPVPFSADVVVDIGAEMDTLVDMLRCHVSQFFEWLPYNGGYADQVPADDASRRRWFKELTERRIRPLADRHRDRVVQTYGVERGHKVEYIEAFEVSEYGSPLDDAARARLFPFLPALEPLGTAAPVEDWQDVRDEE